MQVGLVSPAHVLRYRRVVRWTPESIRKRRDALGMTQEQLAERVGASLRTVWGWEDGVTPQRKWTEKLNEVLGPPSADTPRQESLAEKGAAQLVAEIAERLTELASRVPPDRLADTYESRSDDVPAFVTESLGRAHEQERREALG